MEKRLFKWFGNMERVHQYRKASKVLMAEVSGRRVRDRPRLGWIDCAQKDISGGCATMER